MATGSKTNMNEPEIPGEMPCKETRKKKETDQEGRDKLDTVTRAWTEKESREKLRRSQRIAATQQIHSSSVPPLPKKVRVADDEEFPPTKIHGLIPTGESSKVTTTSDTMASTLKHHSDQESFAASDYSKMSFATPSDSPLAPLTSYNHDIHNEQSPISKLKSIMAPIKTEGQPVQANKKWTVAGISAQGYRQPREKNEKEQWCYLVQWEDDEEENSWEPVAAIRVDAPPIVEGFEKSMSVLYVKGPMTKAEDIEEDVDDEDTDTEDGVKDDDDSDDEDGDWTPE
ncbi:hypothetical protein VTL71DRAFT_4496 [Oculimacula yallundae]|uniref:Chromo domain-containing protein n=1 Tax=Oculimacula yallundae TaxID=86028 RepID=A0ABR4C2S9_9HELO